ncbi:hypothetical protein Tco_0112162 [Tanacetum coccineum]
MVDEEIENLVEGTENVHVDEFMNDIFNDQEEPDNRINPRSYKESPKAMKITDDLTIHNDDEEEESAGDEFELRQREKGKGIEESKDTYLPTLIRSPRTHIAPLSTDKETLQELTVITQDAPSSADKETLQEFMVIDPPPSSSSPKPKTGRFRKSFHELARILQSIMEEALPSMVGDRVNEIAKKTVLLYVVEGLLLNKQKTQADVAAIIVDSFLRNYMSNNILHVHPTQASTSSAQDLQYQLYLLMKDDEKLCNDDFSIWWSLKIKFDKPAPSATPCRTAAIRPRDHDDHHDDAHPEGENSAKRQKFPFPDDDIEERTSRWVSKRIRRFNMYARYSVEH